ncbi:MAG: hypothetical protein KBG92_01205 [Spirochaetes bacterium]|jgi:hypothetical protein|nr:hypothetical protein [Spirochaetota bacterium]
MVTIHLPIYDLLYFFIAMIVLSIKKNAISIHHPTDKKILLEIIAGYLIFIFAHASMILIAGA